jgi:hypothetical protein
VAGCTLLQPDGTRVYDPVKTAQVKAALEPVVIGGFGVLLQDKPRSGDYLRAFGGVFCQMASSGNFTPEYLIDAANKATLPLQAGADPLILLAKDTTIALYKLNYGQRFIAELPESEWPRHVADLFCETIDRALKNAGQAGVK